ncbi:MAG: hypothetical protein HMLIMOIP_000276 [Candidatus Nitrosomirales archaeon]|jgi:hypothetical protein
MTSITVDKDKFVKRCEAVYQRNKEELERLHEGKIVALYEGGVAGIGEDVDTAYKEAAKKHPDKIFYFRRIGKFSASGILF